MADDHPVSYGIRLPHGPSEVLFFKPHEPGVLTRSTIENVQAYHKALFAYHDECCEWYYIFGGGRYDGGYSRKEGMPSFESFFNANLGRWYTK
jgi:hypothetical protein